MAATHTGLPAGPADLQYGWFGPERLTAWSLGTSISASLFFQREKSPYAFSICQSLASVVCLQRSLVEQTSYINSFCGKPPYEVHWSLSIIFINSMTTVLEFYHHYHSSITKSFRQITVQDHGHFLKFLSKISHTKSTDLKCKWSQEPGNCRNRNGSRFLSQAVTSPAHQSCYHM